MINGIKTWERYVVCPVHLDSRFLCPVMSSAEWKAKCEAEWGLQGAPIPDSLNWESVFEAKPFGRNFLRNPCPYGTSSVSVVWLIAIKGPTLI